MFRRPHTFYVEFPPIEGKYAILYFVELFTSQALHILCLSLLLFDSQTPVDEYVGKDWRSIDFRQNHAIHLKMDYYCVFMCQRANRGECQYAVCQVCHEEQSKTQKRTRGRVLIADDLMETCHHELCNLQLCAVYQRLFGW
jgi:hypothetical protein